MNHGISKKNLAFRNLKAGRIFCHCYLCVSVWFKICKLKYRGDCRNTKRDFKILRRDGNENVEKPIGLKSKRSSRFFVHSFAVFTRLRRNNG